MSKNRNRAKLNKCETNKERKIVSMTSEFSYCLICMKRSGSWFYDCSPGNVQAKHRHGSHRIIASHKYRSYKTWKYNRKTKWK